MQDRPFDHFDPEFPPGREGGPWRLAGGKRKANIMKTPNLIALLLACGAACAGFTPSVRAQDEIPYTESFFLEDCRLGPRGVNKYFIPLKTGSFLRFEGEDDGEAKRLLITVLKRTKKVAGVRCAVVREMEWTDDELTEISWNYFAICPRGNDVFYFGEDVDIYEDGEVVSHDGAWLAGVNGARPGLIMPGRPLNGARYYQEIAAGVALDRAEHLSDAATVETPAGTFENCLSVAETSPLEPGHVSFKHYARCIGLIQDGDLKLAAYGCKRGDADDDDDDDKD